MFLIRVVSSNVVLTFLIVLSFPVYLFLICDVFVLLFSLVLIFLIGVVFSSLYYSELSCISFILFLNCVVHPNFFRPGPTDLQLEKFIQEIKIQSRGPRKRKRWDQVIKNLYPKFIFLAMLNEYTEELCWLQMIVVLLKDASSLCLLRIPTHQYTYISPFLRKEGKPAYRTFLWLAVKWSHQCSCELYHVKKEMLCQ